MNDTCSPMSPQPLAFYDPESCVWRMSMGISLWGDPKSLERLPDWGTASAGELFERPTPAPLTAGRDCSSSQLLPTSRATDGEKGGPNQVNGRGVRDSLPGVAPTLLPTATSRDWKGPNQRGDATCLHGALLPTPTASESTGPGYTDRDNGGGRNLRTEVTLLPTPAVNDMGRGKTPQEWDEWTAKMQANHSNGNGHGKSLEIEAQRLSEGK